MPLFTSVCIADTIKSGDTRAQVNKTEVEEKCHDTFIGRFLESRIRVEYVMYIIIVLYHHTTIEINE